MTALPRLLRTTLLTLGLLAVAGPLTVPGTVSRGLALTAGTCATSSYVPSMTWTTLQDAGGRTLQVKHSYVKARTIEYQLGGSGVRELDVEQTLIDGGNPVIAGGDVRFSLVSRLGTEIWDGSVRTARNTKVVMTVCGSWTQTAGRDIGL